MFVLSNIVRVEQTEPFPSWEFLRIVQSILCHHVWQATTYQRSNLPLKRLALHYNCRWHFPLKLHTRASHAGGISRLPESLSQSPLSLLPHSLWIVLVHVRIRSYWVVYCWFWLFFGRYSIWSCNCFVPVSYAVSVEPSGQRHACSDVPILCPLITLCSLSPYLFYQFLPLLPSLFSTLSHPTMTHNSAAHLRSMTAEPLAWCSAVTQLANCH